MTTPYMTHIAPGGLLGQDRCTDCGRPLYAPYRRHDAAGRIVEGCISPAHDGQLGATSSGQWHNRPSAKKFRAEMRKRERELLKGLRRGK